LQTKDFQSSALNEMITKCLEGLKENGSHDLSKRQPTEEIEDLIGI